MSGPEKTMDIEAALRWAFRHELPKAAMRYGAMDSGPAKPGPGWGRIESYAQLLTVVDANRYGVVPDLWSLSAPHPDAIRIGDAVAALDALEVDIPEDWAPLDDMGDLGQAGRDCVAQVIAAETKRSETGLRRLRVATSVLVRKYALLGFNAAPPWQCAPLEVKPVSTRGKPRYFRMIDQQDGEDGFGSPIMSKIEVDGFNEKSRRKYQDAYLKYYLVPDPARAITGRAQYEVWHFALHTLTSQLELELASIRLTPFERSPRPWIQPDAVPSIWPDLEALARPLAPSRKTAENRESRLTCDSRLTYSAQAELDMK